MQTTIFLSTFGLIFLAELGDKTQLTALALALRYPWRKIFVGIAAAFTLLNLAAVIVGKLLFLLLPIFWVTLVSALLFLFFGFTTLRHACDMADDDGPPPSASGAARTAFVMIFMAELGDKTQLVTASQAAQHSASLAGMGMVFAASTLALLLVSLLGIFAGRQLVRIVPLCWIHRAAGVMFLLFGIVTLWKLRGM